MCSSVMGNELVPAEQQIWLDIVKSKLNADQHDFHSEGGPFSTSVTPPTFLDQLEDSIDRARGQRLSSDLLVRISSSTASISLDESEEEVFAKELKRILQHDSNSLSKQSFLRVLEPYLRRLKIKQADSRVSKGKRESTSQLLNGLVDEQDDETTTLLLLKNTCKLLGHNLVTLILECSISLGFWAAVQILLERGVDVSNSSSRLVPSLVEEEIPHLLCLYIANVPDITPQEVHYVLTYFLDSIPKPGESFRPVKSEWRRVAGEETAKVAKIRDGMQSAANSGATFQELEKLSFRAHNRLISSATGLAMATDGFSSPELCMHHLLASGPDENVISCAVSQLSTPQVLALVQYLCKWIERYSSDLGKFPAPQNFRVPSFAQVLSWVGVVLEGHFTQLVLSSDFHKPLRFMEDRIRSLVDSGSRMLRLDGVTEHIKSMSGTAVGKQQHCGASNFGASNFVVEVLDMS